MNAVAVERGAGRSVVTRLLATAPLRLLTPRNAGDGAWVFAATLGGGMVDGDRVDLTVDVGAGATALIGTQSQTKIYPGAAEQHVRATVAEGGLLLWLPDPVVPYAGARWTQSLDVHLGGSLVLVEGLVAGRCARGERWDFARFASRVRVHAPEPVIDDALLLDAAHGPLAERLGRWDALATVMALGPRAAAVAETLERERAGPLADGVRVAISDVAGGVLARIGGASAGEVGRAARRLLAGVASLLGDDPFARKW